MEVGRTAEARAAAWERDWHDARESAPRRFSDDGIDAKMGSCRTRPRPMGLQEHLMGQFALLSPPAAGHDRFET